MPALNTREDLLSAARQIRADLEQSIAAAGPERMEEPGSFGPWTFKDIIAHLTSWRLVTTARLEAGLSGAELAFPWPDHLHEGVDTDAINDWFHETNRDKPVNQVLRESRETFDRVEDALEDLTEDDLFLPDRFPWLNWTDEGLGPAVVRGSWNHYYEEHEPAIKSWLAEGDSA